MLCKLSVICTLKHGRTGRNISSRVLVAAMQCDGRAPGSTTNNAINLGKLWTKLTKKFVNFLSSHLSMWFSFSRLVTMKPNRTREGQLASERIIP